MKKLICISLSIHSYIFAYSYAKVGYSNFEKIRVLDGRKDWYILNESKDMPPLLQMSSDYGNIRLTVLGKGIQSRMCSSSNIQVIIRSIPTPKPEC